MRFLFLTIMVITLMGSPGYAVPPAETNSGAAGASVKPSISLKVKRFGGSNKSTNRGGGYITDSTSTRSLTLDVEVRSLSKTPAYVQMEWFFVAKTVDAGEQWIFDKGSKTLQFTPANMTMKEQLTSSQLTSTEEGFLGMNTKQGSKIEGYIVLVKWNDGILKADASSKPLMGLANDSAKLNKLLETTERLKEAPRPRGLFDP